VNRRGSAIAEVPRRRLEVRAGEVSKARSEMNGPIMNLARSIVEQLPEASGPLNVQVFHDKEAGTTRPIEINARFGGGDPLAWKAGANAPMWLLQEFLGLHIGRRDDWLDGLVMLRYDQGVFTRA